MGSRWTLNNYITQCHSWSQLVGVRGSENQLPAEDLGPQDPRLSRPAEWERSAAKDRGTWGQYVAICSVSNSPLTHNPFATLLNKVWEVYFSKEVCSFVIIVDYVSAYICIRIVVSWLYNIYTYIHKYTYIYTYIYIHIYTYIYTYIYIHNIEINSETGKKTYPTYTLGKNRYLNKWYRN